MNEFRKLMETLDHIEEDVMDEYDPADEFDDEPEYNDDDDGYDGDDDYGFTSAQRNESVNEGDDKSPEDLQQNHPDVYEFLVSILGPYSVRDGKVDAFDLGNDHYVVLKVKPSASLSNTIAMLNEKGVEYNQLTDTSLEGNVNDTNFSVRQELTFGNNTQVWQFKLPKAVEESEGEPVAKPKKRRHRDDNPFGPMYDEEPSFFNRKPQRNTTSNNDDGSRGLSNRDRNR